jgi:predicted outer membrane protein
MMNQPSSGVVAVRTAALVLTLGGGAVLAAAQQGDAEILAQVIAINENEVDAAIVAEQKASITEQQQISAPVHDFAKMLHVQHAKGAQDTKEVATKIGVTPAETPAVEQTRAKGKELKTRLTALTGREFERTFLAEMATGHREVLQKVDGFLKAAQNPAVKQHLTSMRERVAMHLKEAERLQAAKH